MAKKIAIFIPTYNATQTLPLVIDRIPTKIKHKVKEIIVIDNASPDNTYLTAIGYKEKNNLNNLSVIKNDVNKGYGGSQKIAYDYVIRKGYDLIVMLHGDAQYAPEFIPALLERIEKDKVDLVFGSRMKGNPIGGGMPIYKYLGNRLLTWIENRVLELHLSEYHSGYRVFNVHALQQVPFELCSNDYHFDTDILIQFKIKGLRISEEPIPTHYGKESHSPTIWQILKYSVNILVSLYEYLLHINKIRQVGKFMIGNKARARTRN